MDIFSVTSDNLFTPATDNSSAQMQMMSSRALSAGLDQFTAKNYDQAISSFKRAISMAPTADSAINAYDYMARSYLTQGNSQAAIAAYTKALKIAPSRDDLHIQLGNLYTTNGNFDKALAEYKLAVKYNPSSANLYSLGQGYLGAGQTDQAIQQFQLVRRQQPKQPYGDFGLGQAYAKQGNYQEAIAAFKDAVAIKSNYLEAYSEMGYAYVDSGNASQANDVVSTLKTLSPSNTTLAGNLSQYLYDKTAPKMTANYTSDLFTPFLSNFGPGTKVNAIGSYLANAGDQQTFAMVFQFNKQMDQNSVENVHNWSIARAGGTGRGDGYNYNMTVPTTEVTLPGTPQSVYYDRLAQTATVMFKITQNATANGTIDPSHINFSFNGKDMVGLAMDKSADTYSGFSGFA